MLNALIIEDEPWAQNALLKILDKFKGFIKITGICNSIKSSINMIEEQKPHLIFLDLHIKSNSGFEILEYFKDKFTFKVVIITAHDQYAITGYKYGVFDYILKPFDYQVLYKTLNRLYNLELKTFELNQNTQKNKVKIKNDFILLKTELGYKNKNISDIIYISANGSYSTVWFNYNVNLLVSKNIGKFDSLIENSSFFRCHKSYIINLDKIVKVVIQSSKIILSNQIEIPISVRKIVQLRKLLKLNVFE